jgi:hypothetical protein
LLQIPVLASHFVVIFGDQVAVVVAVVGEVGVVDVDAVVAQVRILLEVD